MVSRLTLEIDLHTYIRRASPLYWIAPPDASKTLEVLTIRRPCKSCVVIIIAAIATLAIAISDTRAGTRTLLEDDLRTTVCPVGVVTSGEAVGDTGSVCLEYISRARVREVEIVVHERVVVSHVVIGVSILRELVGASAA